MNWHLDFRILATALFLTINPLVQAQNGISGKLYDEQEQTLPYATVAVIQLPDSTLVAGTTTNVSGEFFLEPTFTGKFILRFSAIGYSSVYTENFLIPDRNFTRNFGPIVMREETTFLNEVVVRSWKPRMEVEDGKLIMQVEGTAMAAGNTAYEMISRAPGISTDQEGNLQLNGKKGVSVMIDDRLTYMSAADLKSLLQGMPAENIEQIEVLNNPSAKYDAEGTAGVLNIKLKKNSLKGTNGSIYSGLTFKELWLPNGGMNMNFRKGNWNSFFHLSITQDGRVRDQEAEREFSGPENPILYDQVGEQTTREFIPSLQFGTDYDLNENHRIGAIANFIYTKKTSDWNTLTDLGDPDGAVMQNIDARNHLEERFGNSRLNLHYRGELDSLGTNLSAELDYVTVKKDADSHFTNRYTFEADNSEVFEKLTNNSVSDYQIYAGKLDLGLPLNARSHLEVGFKASTVISDSELEFFKLEGNEYTFDPERSNQFRYEEKIFAGHVSYSNTLNESWNFYAGLRAEQTYGEGFSMTLNERNRREYLEFFPNFRVEQTVNDNYKIDYSFSRRILRPPYEKFNPFIFYLDPYTYLVGNSELKPQFTSSLQLNQSFYKKFHLLLSYDFNKDYMAEVPTLDPDTQETVYTDKNLDSFKSYSATLIAPVELSSFWKSNNNLVLTRQNYGFEYNGERIENKDYYFMAQSNNQISLPGEVNLEINGTYRGDLAYSVYTIGSQWWIDAAVKRSFLNDKLDVVVRASDIFRSKIMHVYSDYVGNAYKFSQYFGDQAVSLNLRYSFSRGSKTRKTIQSDLEELNRAAGK